MLTISFQWLIWMAAIETHGRGLLLEELIEGQIGRKLSKRAGDLFMGVDNQVESSNTFRAMIVKMAAAGKILIRANRKLVPE